MLKEYINIKRMSTMHMKTDQKKANMKIVRTESTAQL